MMDPDTVVFIEIPSMIKKENSYISQIKQDQKVFWFWRERERERGVTLYSVILLYCNTWYKI